MSLHQLEWQRLDQPVLSAMTTRQDWCRVQLYSPTVIRYDDRYRMWYVGNATVTRRNDTSLGFAESADGLAWTPYPGNPILTPGDLPFGMCWQTPHVIYDDDAQLFKMWFVAAESTRDADNHIVHFVQRLGYATSADGLQWSIHPEPLYPSARRPCVLKQGPNDYLMWMNSATDPADRWSMLYKTIYRFRSSDGLNWERDPSPALSARHEKNGVLYPYVMRLGNGYRMWYGRYTGEGGTFGIFIATSDDGVNWRTDHDAPVLPESGDPNRFDGRYTSTPCVIEGDKYMLLFYSARDRGNLYGAGDGTVRFDTEGIYRHIGVATSDHSG